MTTIRQISALEILDSRGNPTLSVSVTLDTGITASACVPSGGIDGRERSGGAAGWGQEALRRERLKAGG